MKMLYQKSGSYHLMNGYENQDAVLKAESPTAEIIVLADGVSDCNKARRGAQIACEAVSDILLNETEYIFSCEKEKIKGLLTSYVRSQLQREARLTLTDVNEYASTLSFVCRNKISNEVLTFMLGDSMIYSVTDGRLAAEGSPVLTHTSAVYTTTTPCNERLAAAEIRQCGREEKFMIASDGAWRSFYTDGVLSDEVRSAVICNGIADFLEQRQCRDDCSIVILDVMQEVQ